MTTAALPSLAARFGTASAALTLPVGIFALLALMVLPIPALLLDIFFVLNIAISIAVLMAARAIATLRYKPVTVEQDEAEPVTPDDWDAVALTFAEPVRVSGPVEVPAFSAGGWMG
jgi:hypothetical protein